MEFNATTTTGFGDQIWYTSSRFNLYYYPVLGERVCPASDPGCTEKGPLYLVVSGPDEVRRTTIEGRMHASDMGLHWNMGWWSKPGHGGSNPQSYFKLYHMAKTSWNGKDFYVGSGVYFEESIDSLIEKYRRAD